MNNKSFKVLRNPGKKYQTSSRWWQGCPTILRTPKGRLFAGWYSGGVMEPDPENYNLLVRSDDEGWSWSAPELVIPGDPQENILNIDIQLWLDPLQRMWLFISRRRYGAGRLLTDDDHLEVWAIVCDDPDADELQWSLPRKITQGFLRTQPTVLSNGDWLLCAYDWSSPYYRYSRSKDMGISWERCEAGKRITPYVNKTLSNFDEGMILERKDHSLLFFARTQYPLIARCVSPDLEGSVWSEGTLTNVLNASSRFFLRRLNSGRVLLIHNNSANGRLDLQAALSEDDGESWKYSLILDTGGAETRNVSYPDAVEAPDGRIFIIYDCGRTTVKEIRMAQITEKDIIQGSLCCNDSYLNRIINKAPGTVCDQEQFQRAKQQSSLWLKEVYFKLHDL